MKISELARAAGVSVETVRFYERKGLITQPNKPLQGYRDYSAKVLERIIFIKRAQELGFSLNEINELLLLGASQCHEAKELVTLKLADIHHRIKHLKQMEVALTHLQACCEHNQDTTTCPIIESLQPSIHRTSK